MKTTTNYPHLSYHFCEQTVDVIVKLTELWHQAIKQRHIARQNLYNYQRAMHLKQWNNPVTFFTNEEKLRHKLEIKEMVVARIVARLQRETKELSDLLRGERKPTHQLCCGWVVHCDF